MSQENCSLSKKSPEHNSIDQPQREATRACFVPGKQEAGLPPGAKYVQPSHRCLSRHRNSLGGGVHGSQAPRVRLQPAQPGRTEPTGSQDPQKRSTTVFSACRPSQGPEVLPSLEGHALPLTPEVGMEHRGRWGGGHGTQRTLTLVLTGQG